MERQCAKTDAVSRWRIVLGEHLTMPMATETTWFVVSSSFIAHVCCGTAMPNIKQDYKNIMSLHCGVLLLPRAYHCPLLWAFRVADIHTSYDAVAWCFFAHGIWLQAVKAVTPPSVFRFPKVA